MAKIPVEKAKVAPETAPQEATETQSEPEATDGAKVYRGDLGSEWAVPDPTQIDQHPW
jgi:hypothetical protein